MSWRARFSPVIGNVRIFVNPKDPNCFGVRSFLRNNLAELRILNPSCDFSISELSFGEPILYVGYSTTDVRTIRLAGATEDETEDIFSAIATYADTHAIADRGNTDATLDADYRVINFGYAESYNTKIDYIPRDNVGQHGVNAVDDPGQEGRVLGRNNGLKILP